MIKNRIIILITDGENTSGSTSPSDAADIAKEKSIKIYTIGVGTKGMAQSPVAIDFNGKFIYVTTGSFCFLFNISRWK